MGKNKEEKEREKKRKEAEKAAKKEAKIRAKIKLEEERLKRKQEREIEEAKKEGWYDNRKPDYDYKKDIPETNDIWYAAKTGNLTSLQNYIKQGIGLGARDKDGCTALHYAAEYGHVPCVKWILQMRKVDVNIQDRWGMSPLHRACFKKQIETAKFLVSQGGDLNLLTEGGISPFEKALEWGSEFSTPLVLVAQTVDEEGIEELEELEETYADQAVKWGDKTIYVEKEKPPQINPNALAESVNQQYEDIHKEEAIQRTQIDEMKKMSLDQQRALAQLAELAQNDPMQARFLQNQLREVEENNIDQSKIIPELRSITSSNNKSELGQSAVQLLEIARNNSNANHGTVPLTLYNPAVEFAKKFDTLTGAMIQFVITEINQFMEHDEKTRQLNITLKAIVIAIQDLFKIFHPFVSTKYNNEYKQKLIKTGPELQLSVQNLVQSVKGRANALPQFYDRANQNLAYYTQVFVDAVWNMHVASELIANDLLDAEGKEFSASMRQLIVGTFGITPEGITFGDLINYSQKQAIQLVMLTNAKGIELVNSNVQIQLSDFSFSVFKATKGIITISEKVLSDPSTPINKQAITTLGKYISSKLNDLNNLLQDTQTLYSMHNFLDETVEGRLISDTSKLVRESVEKYINSAQNRDLAGEELRNLHECKQLLAQVDILVGAIQPSQYSPLVAINAGNNIGHVIERMVENTIILIEVAYSETLEQFILYSLQLILYFSNQIRIITSSLAVGSSFTTKIMIALTVRSIACCVSSVLSALSSCMDALTNPFSNDVTLQYQSQPLPQLPQEEIMLNQQFDQNIPPNIAEKYAELNTIENNMGTLRVTRDQSNKILNASPLQPLAQLSDPVSVKNADFATIKASKFHSPQIDTPPPMPNIPPPRDEIDDLFDLINS